MKSKTYSNDFIQYDKKKGKSETIRLTVSMVTQSLLYVAIVFFAIFFLWYFVFISTHAFYVVSGKSMMPTLNSSGYDTDAVYVDTTSSIEKGNIVVISTSASTSIIKRVIAVEGDYVSIFKSEVEVELDDGTTETQSVFHLHRIDAGTAVDGLTNEDTLVDEESGNYGYSIITTNNWGNASGVGYFEGDEFEYEPRFFQNYIMRILGSGQPDENGYLEVNGYNYLFLDGAWYIQVPENCFFYLGDNRSNSTDGRDNGFGELENVVGTVDVVVLDYDYNSRFWAVVEFYFKEIEIFFER